MHKLPVVQDKDFIRVIEKLGFVFKRQTGSHRIYKHSDGRRVVVPVHQGRDIPVGTVKGILTDIKIDIYEFVRICGSL